MGLLLVGPGVLLPHLIAACVCPTLSQDRMTSHSWLCKSGDGDWGADTGLRVFMVAEVVGGGKWLPGCLPRTGSQRLVTIAVRL